MEFRVLGGQHMLGYEFQYIGASGDPFTRLGGMYVGEHFKITTSGSRAIIYKKKEKHPVFKDRYTFSYFLLGDGEIVSNECAVLSRNVNVKPHGWGDIKLSAKDIAALQATTVADFNTIQEPLEWHEVTYLSSAGLMIPYIPYYRSYPATVFSSNLQVGKQLSSTMPSKEWESPFFGFPASLHSIKTQCPNYCILNKIWNNEFDTYFPTNYDDLEYIIKSTLLWNNTGKLTPYGKQFASSGMFTGYDLYSMMASSPYTWKGSEHDVTAIRSNSYQSPFSVDSNNMSMKLISDSGDIGIGTRMGTTNKGDFFQNFAEEYIFAGILITEDYEGAKKYVEDGTVPDDAKKIDDITTTTDEDDTQNEDGKDNSKRDDQPLNNPDYTALNSGSTTYFYMGREGISSFIKWFWNNTGDFESIVNNYITNLYGDLKECITGVFHFPCPLNALCTVAGNKEIVIGRYHTKINADFLETPPKNILLGTVNLDDDKWKNTNSFLDYDGYTTISMYLPYLGVVDLPTKTVQKTKLSVYYAVDVPSMQLKYTIKSNGLIVHEQVVQFGDDIPISLSSGLQNVTNTVSAVTGMAADVALLGTMGGGKKAIASTLVHTVANAHTTTDGITVKGNSSGVMGKWGSLKCALIVTKPISKRPSNYAQIKGNLICDTYKLSSLTGLTICENPRITFTNSKPTEKEIEEIYSFLEKGVIL